MTDEPERVHAVGPGEPTCRSRLAAVVAPVIPFSLLPGGILIGSTLFDDIGLGITLGLGVNAVAAGACSTLWGRSARRANG
ncbi:hypothetical protein ACF09C_08330 [Streptomyces sp. NPDC014870]|uniref:hypothetical protein n=1 Tax=Streptomyces sp. NPDC014870 TaxID=3364925 RepID=UPI003700317F